MCHHEVYAFSPFTAPRLIADDMNMSSVGDYYRGCGVSVTRVVTNIDAVMTRFSLTALPWALLHRRGFGLQLSEMQDK